MSERTGIAWTDHTFNPWWGCFKVSPGCANCYAETLSSRYGQDVWGPAKTTQRRTFRPKHWQAPVKWNAAAEATQTRRRVFSGSMCDVFEDHPGVTAERWDLWRLIRSTPWLDWQLLTKRPENIEGMLPDDWGQGYANVWLGTSVEDQQRADERIPHLLTVPARIHFLSCEPLLGDLDLRGYLMMRGAGATTGIDWIIIGGESGPKFRMMEPHWLANIVHEARQYSPDAAVFVKQDSAFRNEQRGRIPDSLWIREFPEPRLMPTGLPPDVSSKASER
jgi:protein gp37